MQKENKKRVGAVKYKKERRHKGFIYNFSLKKILNIIQKYY